jgi:hypothetical protein
VTNRCCSNTSTNNLVWSVLDVPSTVTASSQQGKGLAFILPTKHGLQIGSDLVDGNRATEGELQDYEEIIQIEPETLKIYTVSAQRLKIG